MKSPHTVNVKSGNRVEPGESLSPESLRAVAKRQDADAAVALVRRYYDLFNERRFDDAARLISSEASFIHRPTKERLVGPAGFRTFAAAWVRAVPDARVRIVDIAIESGTWVKVNFVGRGTHSGTLDLGEIQFPPTGRIVELPFCQRFDIQGGEIVEAVLEFDLQTMRGLLGG
jgi:predicted ester cyclase